MSQSGYLRGADAGLIDEMPWRIFTLVLSPLRTNS